MYLCKALFIILKFLVSFVTLFAWLVRDEVDALSEFFSASGQLVDGCPFLLQLKHSLSFQYSLSKSLLPLLPLLFLPLPPLWPLPPCINAAPSACVILCTNVFLYLSRSCRFCCRLLGYQLYPVVKSFCRSTFLFPCWVPLCLSKV